MIDPVPEAEEIKRKLGELSKQMKKTQESIERLRERTGTGGDSAKKTRRIPKVAPKKKS
jgi:hypothetical protein